MYSGYPPPPGSYTPGPGYGSYAPGYPPPSSQYGAPPGTYGAPPQTYGAPPGTYGAPAQYGGASISPYGAAPGTYGAPASPYGAPGAYGAPHGAAPGAPHGAAPGTAPGGPTYWYTQLFTTIPPQEVQQLQAWFQSMDTGYPCTGRISAMPLTSLQFGGKNLEITAAEKAARIFDKDGSRLLTFHDFACLYRYLTLVVHSFQRNDINRDGLINTQEATKAVAELSLGCSEKSVSLYYRKFAGFLTTPMSLPVYIAMCIELALVKSRLELADPFRQGKVVFTLDTLAQVSTET